MTYQPLARKYRPTKFAELVGQESVAETLAHAIALGREPHGVIFTGVRGIGKTTVARLYAKALNCDARVTTAKGGVEPCGICESCKAITTGNHEDVIEIDGASNTGVADVRALQETVSYLPQRSAFKVYIVDEVHMLSAAAFNALLKTLEEPPGHVVFVFATTELHKVPETILSRCQAFYLKKLPPALILGRLRELLAVEKIQAEDKAVAVVAREGHGSMRDALTLLDQAIALGGGKVTVAALGPLVSNLSSSPYLELLDALVHRDAPRALAATSALDRGGIEFVAVAEETAQWARHAFVVQGLGPGALDVAMLGLDDGELATLGRIAKEAAPLDLNRIFRTLVKSRLDLDGSTLDRYIFENYLYEWCFDPGFPDVDSILGGAKPAQRTQPSVPAAQTKPLPERAPAPVAASPSPSPAPQPPKKEFPESWKALVDAWKQLKPLQARKLEEVHPLTYTPARIALAIPENSFASKSLLQKDEQTRLRDLFKELFAFTGDLIVSTVGGAQALPETLQSEKARADAVRRAAALEAAREAPFTRDLVNTLGGRIEDVRIPEKG